MMQKIYIFCIYGLVVCIFLNFTTKPFYFLQMEKREVALRLL